MALEQHDEIRQYVRHDSGYGNGTVTVLSFRDSDEATAARLAAEGKPNVRIEVERVRWKGRNGKQHRELIEVIPYPAPVVNKESE